MADHRSAGRRDHPSRAVAVPLARFYSTRGTAAMSGIGGSVWYGGVSPHCVAMLRVVDFSSRTGRASSLRVREVLEVLMTAGTIKKVVADRGFGFISAEDEKEYFFHRGGLDTSLDFDRLVGGEPVVFDVEQSPKGPRANNVRSA
jgi:cold shock protein